MRIPLDPRRVVARAGAAARNHLATVNALASLVILPEEVGMLARARLLEPKSGD